MDNVHDMQNSAIMNFAIDLKHTLNNINVCICHLMPKDYPKFHFIWKLDQCEDVMEGPPES